MALTHALAHALTHYKPELTSILKHEGFGGAKVSKSAYEGKEGLQDESN